MENAPPDPSLGQYALPEQVFDRCGEEQWVNSYIPLAVMSLESPPPGEVRLVELTNLPEDRDAAREFEQELHQRRSRTEELVIAGDGLVRFQQAAEFGLFTCKMLSQRFQIAEFIIQPTFETWHARFCEPEVIQRAQTLQERHAEVLIVVDRTTGEFELCGPETRAGRLAGSLVASMTPVFDALALRGLWIGTDRQFRELARAVVRLAEAEHARLGPDGFSRRYSNGVAR